MSRPLTPIIMADLVEGYGVEDIAIRRNIHVSTVRYAVKMMRRSGLFLSVFPRKSTGHAPFKKAGNHEEG